MTDRSSEQLDGGRWANAQREDHNAPFGRRMVSSECGYWSERRLVQVRSRFRSRGLCRYADGAFGRFATIRVMMRSKSNC